MAVDPGLFGPDSVSWRVQQEATVMLGGARALLMHSAPPAGGGRGPPDRHVRHACLVDSFLEFERLTVGRLDEAGRQAFHEESMVSAELLRLPRERIPPTVPALRAYLDVVMASGILRMTDGARRALLRASVLGLRAGRPLAPTRIRFVAPAVMAGWRLEGRYGSLAEAAAHWPGG